MFKIKHERTADCVVAGYRVHKSGADAIGSLLLGLYKDDGTLASVGVIGAFPMAERRRLLTELQPLVTTFEDHPWNWAAHMAGDRTPRRNEGSRWNAGKDLSFVPLRPERVVEVRYDHMEGERFRHTAQFNRWRPDREPRSVPTSSSSIRSPSVSATSFLASAEQAYSMVTRCRRQKRVMLDPWRPPGRWPLPSPSLAPPSDWQALHGRTSGSMATTPSSTARPRTHGPSPRTATRTARAEGRCQPPQGGSGRSAEWWVGPGPRNGVTCRMGGHARTAVRARRICCTRSTLSPWWAPSLPRRNPGRVTTPTRSRLNSRSV